MVLRALLLLVVLLGGLGSPATAHREQNEIAAKEVKDSGANRSVTHPMSPEVHDAVKEDIARLEKEASRSLGVRLVDWAGRMHPFAVHFPIALFPVAWIAHRRGYLSRALPLRRRQVV